MKAITLIVIVGLMAICNPVLAQQTNRQPTMEFRNTYQQLQDYLDNSRDLMNFDFDSILHWRNEQAIQKAADKFIDQTHQPIKPSQQECNNLTEEER